MLALYCVYFYRVESDLIVKLTDNSLARDLFPGDYNCLGDNENRPVKWLSVEAITERRFSPPSDVVSVTVVFVLEIDFVFSCFVVN